MIFDGHSDIWSDVTIKRLSGETNVLEKHHLKRLEKGNVEGAIFVAWVDPPYTSDPKKRTQQIFDSIDAEIAECDKIAVVKSYDEIIKAREEGKFYVLNGMEGLSGLEPDESEINRVYEEHDIRHISVTWNEQNCFGTGIQGDANCGLTDLGKRIVNRISELGIIMDVSHANEKTFWDIADVHDGQIVATHSNAKSLCNAPRNLSDEQIKEIGAHNGLIGINSFYEFVSKDSDKQNSRYLVEHISHIAELIGVDKVAFGFDFFEFLPSTSTSTYSDNDYNCLQGLEDCSQVPMLVEKMRKAGFTEADIKLICRENWMRIIKEVV